MRGGLARSCKCPQNANDTRHTTPRPSRGQPLPRDTRERDRPAIHRTRPVRAARRPRGRRPRRRAHAGHVLLRPAAPPRLSPRRAPRADHVGRLAHATRPLRPARSHRPRACQAAVPARRWIGPVPQHDQPRAPPPRGSWPHLPPRLRKRALARQDPTALRPHRSRLQRLAPAAARAARPRHAGHTDVVRRRQGGAGPVAQTARTRLHDALRHRSAAAAASAHEPPPPDPGRR